MSTSKMNYDQLVDAAGNYTIAKGEKGSPGIKGAPGYNGAKGQKGLGGATGAAGDKGAQGIAGAQGAAGAKGQKGGLAQLLTFKGVKANTADLPSSGNTVGDVWFVTAETKFYGWNGTAWGQIGGSASAVKGEKGVAGTDGAKGQKGTAATKGQKGEDGATGAKGQKGFGVTGDKGQKGQDGVTASKGQKGAAGSNGTNGSDGVDGTKGNKGASGVNGNTGATGDKGNAGAKGTDGDKGIKGEKGQIAEKGQKGEANGPKGATGATGAKGQKGSKGEVGQNGVDGNEGPKGSKGEPDGQKGAKGQKGDVANPAATFTGNIIPDNSTLSGALQAIETAVEGRATLASGNTFAASQIFQGEHILRDKLSIDPDGGFHMELKRNSSTQCDILLRNPPSGATLNINTVNSHGDDTLTLYSSKVWFRALGGGTGHAEFDGNVQIDGSLTVGSTNVATELSSINTSLGNKADTIALLAVQADVDQNEADADAAIALRAPIDNAVFTGITKTPQLEVDNDGVGSGFYYRFNRNGNTQFDFLGRNIPSGGVLNINCSNGNNAQVQIHSELFWVRDLTGNGKAQFDGDVTMKLSSSVTPANNTDLMIEATNDTTLTFKYKGSDGTVRSGTISLS